MLEGPLAVVQDLPLVLGEQIDARDALGLRHHAKVLEAHAAVAPAADRVPKATGRGRRRGGHGVVESSRRGDRTRGGSAGSEHGGGGEGGGTEEVAALHGMKTTPTSPRFAAFPTEST
jgi:hypothetical protein